MVTSDMVATFGSHNSSNKDHPWRSLKNSGMTVHYSGMTVEAQKRIQKGVEEMLTNAMEGTSIRPEYVIVDNNKVASQSYQTKKINKFFKETCHKRNPFDFRNLM